eukprot:GILJ01001294.1.p1 GENE.GILJ01001294.1~~GILJ01001294.1.p1  ORF type:complete len:241 (-),score=18.84 GILJ01001294.1:74-796(-)
MLCVCSTQCAGVHRGLGVQVSQVMSCKLDHWSEEQIQMMQQKGNDVVNEMFAWHVPTGVLKPAPDAERPERESFINAKYVDKAFYKEESRPRQPPAWTAPASTVDRLSYRNSSSAGMVEFVGMLEVHLIEGINLVAGDLNGLSDPYCVVQLGRQQMKTRKKKNTLNPRWEEKLLLCWDGKDALNITVYDWDRFTKDDFIGSARVALDQLQPNKPVEFIINLEEVSHGQVRLSATFIPISH